MTPTDTAAVGPETAPDADADAAAASGCLTNCDDSNACTLDFCVAELGKCLHPPLPDNLPCSDGQVCTVGDTCKSGTCAPGAQGCDCQTDADCATADTASLCDGSLYCDKSAGPYTCKLNPGSVVNCPPSATQCQVSGCAEPKAPGNPSAKAVCVTLPATDGTPCDDSKGWTVGDVCQAGTCASGTNTAQCVADADCAAVEDGDICNGTLFCNKAKKVCQINPKTIVSCPSVDNTVCRSNQCQPKTGQCKLVAKNELGACDDGNKCTVGEACVGGQCSATKAQDVCICKSTAECEPHEDGNLCNGTLFCDLAKGVCKINAATVVTCMTGLNTQCLEHLCDAKSGLCGGVALPNGATCEADGNLCTASDTCQGGVCSVGSNICECQADAQCAGQEDGDFCNGTLYCDQTSKTCKLNPATLVNCPNVTDTECQKNLCNPLVGACSVVPVNHLGPCTDGNPCTKGDACLQGKCISGESTCVCQNDGDCAPQEDGDLCNGTLYCDKTGKEPLCAVNPASILVCPSANNTACMHNQCQPQTGKCQMSAVNIKGPCDDGDSCTAGDICTKLGACQAGADLCECHSSTDCLDDGDTCNGVLHCDTLNKPFFACKPKPGTVPVDGAACSDSNLCTGGDSCKNGLCVAGKAVGCSDGNTCTNDDCDKGLGCVNLANAATCSDGNLCTVTDLCSGGACTPGDPLACDDKDGCTNDFCSATAGCKASANTMPCDDGSVCTVNDTCKDAGCVAGKPLVCNDGNGCTVDSCDKSDGCVQLPSSATCSDGNVCSVDDACAAGQCQPGSALLCDDNNPCTTDACAATSGCKFTPTTAPCDDGSVCTAGDVCSGSACKPGKPVSCNDGNVCSNDTCDSSTGCANQQQTGTLCDAQTIVNGACKAGVCLAATCIDQILDGAESDVDCGVGCGFGCAPGRKCKLNQDCGSKICTNGLCAAPTLTVAGALYVDLRAYDTVGGTATWANRGTLGNFTAVGLPAYASNTISVPGVAFDGKTSAYIGPVMPADVIGNSDRTIEFWAMNPVTDNVEESVVCLGRRGIVRANLSVNFGPTSFGASVFTLWGDDFGWPAQPADNQWHHVVLVYDGAQSIKVYLDGTLALTRVLGGALVTTDHAMTVAVQRRHDDPTKLAFLNEFTSVPMGFSGFINSLRVHGGVLSAVGVAVNFTAGPYLGCAKDSDCAAGTCKAGQCAKP